MDVNKPSLMSADDVGERKFSRRIEIKGTDFTTYYYLPSTVAGY